jgi:hypothetical protein
MKNKFTKPVPAEGQIPAREGIEMMECRKDTRLFTVFWTLSRTREGREYSQQVSADQFLLEEHSGYRRRVARKLIEARRRLGHR